MNEQEIIEGNKLIAEFMADVTTSAEEWTNTNKKLAAEYKYHSSWDWLMPVVEKIESLTLKEVIGLAASQPYWQDEKIQVGICSIVGKNDVYLPKKATDFPVVFTINGKAAWIQYYYCGVSGGDGHFSRHEVSATSKIEATWKCIVDFIKWYNEQSPNQIKQQEKQ